MIVAIQKRDPTATDTNGLGIWFFCDFEASAADDSVFPKGFGDGISGKVAG
ncbi:MAG: hypothetical protein J0H34_21645 [Rhizobiales bacterium]|nr:hypothetical protein [Hyphomicrobiales bacterium]